MKNKCTVIHIDGLRGMLILGFIIMCSIAGFIIFPAWLCQHGWNFVAAFVDGMPLMELKHGALLWLIIALISYVTLFGKLKVSFVSAKEESVNSHYANYTANREILEELEQKIREKLKETDNSENDELKSKGE